MTEKSIYESVFDVPPHASFEQSLCDVFSALTRQEWNKETIFAEERRLSAIAAGEGITRFAVDTTGEAQIEAATSQTDIERLSMMYEIMDMFSDYLDNCNTIFDWPVYERLIKKYGNPSNGGNALVLGALTPLSARAFTALANEVYGTDRSYIVDIVAGKDKQKHGSFVFGDALSLPFRDESMDIVHTSKVFAKMDDKSGAYPTPQTKIVQTIKEAGRVLRPGGQMLMIEDLPHVPLARLDGTQEEYIQHLKEAGEQIVPSLRAAGFGAVAMEPCVSVATRQFIFDAPRYSFTYDNILHVGKYAIHAVKSPYTS